MSTSTAAAKPAKGHTYRPDIDGLRALAVLFVLADHLGTRLHGGFVGVAIFFVISGYLISAVILDKMRSGCFSILDFYERRIRRIFPAMLLMMFVVTLLVYQYFVPSEVEAYGRSSLAALFSVSNFIFWHQSGYFDDASAIKPLLHTWSLAVEEQFYILFPIFLVCAYRLFPKHLRAAIVALTCASFIGAALTVHRSPTTAFFFAPLRAWELLIGTIVSQKYFRPIQGTIARNIASGAGLLLVVFPSFAYSDVTPFPGLSALVPCAGAALISLQARQGRRWSEACFLLQPVRFIGLISYSLHLWHWPILVLQRTNSLLFPSITNVNVWRCIVSLMAILVATLSWAFVEQPFRTGRFRPDRTALLR